MPHIFRDFRIRKSGEVVMDSDPLAQGFMDRLSQSAVQMGFSAEDQGKTVKGIIAVIHEHPDVVEDSRIEKLRLIHCKDERLPLFPVKVFNLLLDGLEAAGLASPEAHSEDLAQFAVEFGNADSRQADVFHVVLVRDE